MATRIAEINLNQPIQPVRNLSGYGRIWLLIRHGLRPIGWIRCPRSFAGDELLPETIYDLIAQQLGVALLNALRAGNLELPKKTPSISVIVCTREHPEQLRRQLQSLAKLQYPNFDVIVVDNAPRSDATRLICEEFSIVKYVLEKEPGLDYARNAGLRAARSEIVAYTDDDACVDPYWLHGLARGYSDPTVQCVTGLTLPYELETPAQEYFEMYGGMQKGFRRRVYHPGTWRTYFPLGSGTFGAGVNLSLRRTFLESIGGFDLALDTGSPTRGGGDLDVMARVLQNGGTLIYEPSAIVWHQHRPKMSQLEQQMFDYGFGFYAYLGKYASGDLELQNHAMKLMRRWFNFWGFRRLRKHVKDALLLRPHFPIHLILLEMLGMIRGRRAYAHAAQRVKDRAVLLRLKQNATTNLEGEAPAEPPAAPPRKPRLAGRLALQR